MSNSQSENLYGTAYAGQAVAVIPIEIPGGPQIKHQLNLRYCSGVGLGPVGTGWSIDHKKIIKSQQDKSGTQYFLSDEHGSREFRSDWSHTAFVASEDIGSRISAWTDDLKHRLLPSASKLARGAALGAAALTTPMTGAIVASVISHELGTKIAQEKSQATSLVEEPSGVQLLFGKTPESRSFGRDWTAAAVINISEIHYPNGESVVYSYRKPGYLDSFKIVDYIFAPPSLLETIEYYVGSRLNARVMFGYENRTKTVGETSLRLKNINVYGRDMLLHTYKLGYNAQDLLETVEQCDSESKMLRKWKIDWEIRNGEPLLGEFVNDRGASTSFRYQLAADYPDNDSYIPTQVVSERIVKDGQGGNLITQYDYCGGRVDPAEGFVGFQKVIAREPDGTTVITYAHTDPIFRGRERLIEVVDAGGNLVQCTHNTWRCSQDAQGVKRIALQATKVRFFEDTKYLGAPDKYDYDHGEGYAWHATEYQYNPDYYYLTSTKFSCSDDTAFRVHNFFRRDIGSWNWKIIKEQEMALAGETSTVIAEHLYEYDLRGNQTRKTVTDTSHEESSGASYYPDGRPDEAVDAQGVAIRFVYDDEAALVVIERNGTVVQSFAAYGPNENIAAFSRNITSLFIKRTGTKVIELENPSLHSSTPFLCLLSLNLDRYSSSPDSYVHL